MDKKGFLWLATEGGLFRYDGYSFLHYKVNPSLKKGSLSQNLLFSIYQDKNGNLWCGSLNGLNQYNPKLDNFTQYYPHPDTTLRAKANFIQRIAEDQTGSLWIATANGLFQFDLKTKKFRPYPTNPSDPASLSNLYVRSMLIDSRGMLWAGTEKGLNQIDIRAKKNVKYFHDPANPFSLSNDKIRSIYEDKRGNIWVGTEKGLNKLNLTSGTVTRYTHRPRDPYSLCSDTVLSITEDNFQRLWVGTWNGLSILDSQQEKFNSYFHNPSDPKSISGNTVTALFTDYTGATWIGTNQGINRVEVNTKKFQSYFYNTKSYKSDNYSVNALLEDQDDIYWMGTKNYLVKFDKKNNQYNYINCSTGPKAADIQAINRDKNGIIWIGCRNGLYALNPATLAMQSFAHVLNQEIWDIHIDKEGIFWIGTINGLYKFNPQTKQLVNFRKQPSNPYSISHNRVGTIIEDREGTLWIGTALGGLNKFDKKNERFFHYRHDYRNPASISSDTVIIIFEDTKGLLWIGTGNGLNLFNKETGTFSHYMDDNYKMNDVCGILEDNHRNLWVNHLEGICKFNIGAKTYNYYQGGSDGLQSEYNVGDNLKNKKGELFFSGSDGLTVFHPDSIRDNTFVPPVVITNFSVFNKPVPIDGRILQQTITDTKEITLSYDQFIFSFEFAALNFTNPEKNQYAYKLEGFEKYWNYVGNRRFASYSNIPSGKSYVFKVKGSNDDGVWNPKETTIKIYITPPFWETAWFKSLSIFSFASLLFTGYKLRVQQFKKQKQVLENQVRERTAEISKQKEQIQEQALEIEKFNQLLQKDNLKLVENVKDLSQARVMQKQVSFEEFKQIYPDEEACLKFLTDLKWGKGYQCTKCRNANYSAGPVPYSRRCSKCSSVERATTGTIFSRMKFPITKAFYMLFLLSQGKNMTVDELAEILGQSRQTCWAFRKKIMEVISAKSNTKKNRDGWSHLVLVED